MDVAGQDRDQAVRCPEPTVVVAGLLPDGSQRQASGRSPIGVALCPMDARGAVDR